MDFLARLQILGGEHRVQGLKNGHGNGLVGADFEEKAHQAVALADLQHFGLRADEHLVAQILAVVLKRLIDDGGVRQNRRTFCFLGTVRGQLQFGFAITFAENERLLRISEVLGSHGDEAVHLVGIELDIVGLGQEPSRYVDNVDEDRLGGGVRSLAIANGRRVGIELEGIEGGKFVIALGEGGRQPGDDTKIRLDGNELTAALALCHCVVNDVAVSKARGRHLNTIAFLAGGCLPIVGKTGATRGAQGGEARSFDGVHHAGAVGNVHGGIDGDTDEANAHHAGETGARHPFQTAAGTIMAVFAQINRRQFAFDFGCFAKKYRGESTRPGRHKCLT